MIRVPMFSISLFLVLTSPVSVAPGVETLLVIEPSEERPRNSEGDIVELSDGRLLLSYTRFKGGSSDFAAADIVARTSSDGGKTWSEDRMLVENEGDTNVMSVSLVPLASGEILFFYLLKNNWGDLRQYVRRTSDDFETLSDPIRTTMNDGYNVVNNDRVVQLSTGRLIVPSALHPCPDKTQETWSPYGITHICYSDDEGKTWKPDATDVSTHPPKTHVEQEPGIVELADGRLWMYIRTDAGVQYERFSEDDGIHWSESQPTGLHSPTSPATIERIPWTGDLLCVWNDHSGWHNFPEGRRTPLCVAISTDDGKTWSKSRVIEGDPDGWYCYTAMTFLEDRVLLAYCAGDKEVGGLNRLKVTGLSKDWLYQD